jgi:hypothetical protein
MERQNRPPPLAIPKSPPANLSTLSYYRTPSAGLPVWASNRRKAMQRRLRPLNNPAGITFLALLIFTGTLTWLLLYSGGSTATTSSPLSQIPEPSIPRPSAESKSEGAVPIVPHVDLEPETANSTLNFQKIFAINLPSRLDRRDILTLMAKYSNLSVTIVPGVRSLAENILPPPRRPGALRMEEYAVWRAHANVWRKVLEEGITTALIMEDDNDWDLNLKEQIPRIMKALDEIRHSKPQKEDEGVVRGGQEAEPWDILYLGACMETPTTRDSKGRRIFVPIPSDRGNVHENNYNWVSILVTILNAGRDNPSRA